MIVSILGRRIRLELLPPPARPRLRWDGSPQAYPVSLPAIFARSARTFGDALAALSGPMPPRRRQPDYLARHLR